LLRFAALNIPSASAAIPTPFLISQEGPKLSSKAIHRVKYKQFSRFHASLCLESPSALQIDYSSFSAKLELRRVIPIRTEE
jgi:hypothetical protein